MMRFKLFQHWGLALVLLGAAGAGSALTLGRVQGVALIGRPLDAAVQIGLDSPAEAADLCPEVEVFYGENRVEPRRVDLRTAPAPNAVNVQVRVSAPVDEAYVTLYLRVGCSQKLTRRYVLLSEQPGDAAEAAARPAPVAPALPAVVPGTAAAAVAPAGSADGDPAPVVRRAPPVRPQATSDASVAAAPPRRAAPPAPPAAAAAPPPPPAVVPERPRLKLEAVDLAARPAALPVGELPSTALALGAAAEELQRSAERIQSLESELQALREGMVKRDAALAELRQRLEQAERSRYANGLVYALGGLALVALGLAAFFWRRGGELGSGAWWVASDTAPAPVRAPVAPPPSEAARAPDADAPALVVPALRASPSPRPTDAVTPDRSAEPPVSPPAAAPVMPAVPVPPAASRATPAEAEGLRVSDPLPLTTDELSDIQQEADFFISLGEYDRAIEVLRNHIEIHPQASPLAWLDLLQIHHRLGQQEDYEQLRRDFEWLFNAKVPPFAQVVEDLPGLEGFGRLMARIQAAWPRRDVVQVIDDAIFRRPGGEGDEALNVQAYRDLLFLHDLATAVVEAEEAALVPSPVPPGVALDIDIAALERAAQPSDSETRPA